MISWNGCGRKCLWPNFKVLPRHFPEGSEENHENLVKIAGLGVEILTQDLPNTKQECYALDHDIRLQFVN
jgi:hypothetical protein